MEDKRIFCEKEDGISSAVDQQRESRAAVQQTSNNVIAELLPSSNAPFDLGRAIKNVW